MVGSVEVESWCQVLGSLYEKGKPIALICSSEEAEKKYYRRSRKRASDFMQRRYESFAEGVERIIRGEMLRKSKWSMRRKSLLKISNEGESRKLKIDSA
jgi:hypothetical protein